MFKSVNILRQSKIRKSICGFLTKSKFTNKSVQFLNFSFKPKRFLVINDSSENDHSSFNRTVNVSKYNKEISDEKITGFLTKHNIEHRSRGNGQITAKVCPLCPSPHKSQMSNLWTLNFKSDDGAFLCFRCSNYGSWFDFIKAFLGSEINFEKQNGNYSPAAHNGQSSLNELERRENMNKQAADLNLFTNVF